MHYCYSFDKNLKNKAMFKRIIMFRNLISQSGEIFSASGLYFWFGFRICFKPACNSLLGLHHDG